MSTVLIDKDRIVSTNDIDIVANLLKQGYEFEYKGAQVKVQWEPRYTPSGNLSIGNTLNIFDWDTNRYICSLYVTKPGYIRGTIKINDKTGRYNIVNIKYSGIRTTIYRTITCDFNLSIKNIMEIFQCYIEDKKMPVYFSDDETKHNYIVGMNLYHNMSNDGRLEIGIECSGSDADANNLILLPVVNNKITGFSLFHFHYLRTHPASKKNKENHAYILDKYNRYDKYRVQEN